MADKNIQMSQRNVANTGWDNLNPKTLSSQVFSADGATSVASSLADIVNDYTTTLNTTWSGSSAPFTKVQTVTGILVTDTPIIDVVMSGVFATDELIADAWGLIYRAVATTNTITFYATEKPTVSLPIQLKAVR